MIGAGVAGLRAAIALAAEALSEALRGVRRGRSFPVIQVLRIYSGLARTHASKLQFSLLFAVAIAASGTKARITAEEDWHSRGKPLSPANL